jgi:hypothetical protein
MKDSLERLLKHKDPKVRADAEKIQEHHNRRTRLIQMVQEALQQLRLDMKYLVFDLECTRKERDELKEEKEGGV